MRASKVSFDQMMIGARNNPILGEATSFIQVEYGLDELKSSWQGFIDTSDHYNLTFTSRKNVHDEFANALADYVEYLAEPPSIEMGR
jgi:hypothetical protein